MKSGAQGSGAWVAAVVATAALAEPFWTPGLRVYQLARRLRLAFCITALVVIGVVAPMAATAETGDNAWVQQTSAEVDAAERQLANLETTAAPSEALDAVLATATDVHDKSQACLEATENRLTALVGRLDAMGEVTALESTEVKEARQALERERAQLEARESACRLLLVRARELTEVAGTRAQALMAEQLLARGPHLGEVLSQMLADPGGQLTTVAERMIAPLVGLGWADVGIMVLLFITGLLVGRASARLIRPSRGPEVVDCVSGSAIALRATGAQMLPVLLATLAVSLYLAWLAGPASVIAGTGFAVTAWLMALTLIRMVLCPPLPALPFLPLADLLRRSLFLRATVLSVLLLVGFLAFALIPWQSDSETTLLFFRALYASVLAVNLSWILVLTGNFLRGWVWRLLRSVTWILLLVALGAEWLGYHTLAPYLLRGVTGSVAVLILGPFLARFFADLFDGLDEGRLGWQARMRTRIGLTSEMPLPGLMWLRVLFALSIWAIGSYLVLLSWGLSAEGAAMLGRWLIEGFEIGDLRLVPTQILAALLIFGLLTTVVGWMQGRVVPSWLSRTRLDTGAREAVAAITSYTGIVVAALVALSMAGIGFQNFAIVAGALSVGIGFGLQNIVNNFVSGMILLFERPIRRGDWIEVGDTQGYVRRISIRSTRLETFDRSEVIVPNAELTTTQVTNWQLHDSWGRVIVPVPVAYGTDTEKVKEILLRVAKEHPNTMSGSPMVPEPVVLFRGFGDSSLDFELRFFIPQIDQRLMVASDINFAVDAAFRDQGIEIPFPQRDVHLKSPPAGDREPE